jgi:Amt family ammonium transporter
MDKLNTANQPFTALIWSSTGLATITPAAGYVNVTAAIIIGFVSAIICYYAVSHLKPLIGSMMPG